MSTQVIAEYPSENIALLRDGEGLFIFTRDDSILPIDDEPNMDFHPQKSVWYNNIRQSRSQDIEDDIYIGSMH